ncbi:hypothetical protein C8N46_11431 [Kordia periserrulae]|uniref:Uncharacterized protein n=1 Tax=Kordia periserrulae TaxID=701523 RepID=A0A2T6BQR5_9FLAO|nr:hypothetical protein [Kordia periserrulae]PTX58386.1 hypothetical protein C8N46_11431 [Kordia periserrulae]
MKIRYKHKEKAKNAKLEQENYQVLGYGDFSTESNIFLIANDELKILNFDQTSVEIIDDDLSEYVRRDDLNYGKRFYLNSKLNQVRNDLIKYSDLTFSSIWNFSRNYKFFKESNYEISDFYKDYVLNEEYKLNLIEGFLIFANDYIDRKFGVDHYREAFNFYKTESLELLVQKKTDDIQFFESKSYSNTLMNFISETLWDENQNEEKSKSHRLHFFWLIDSLFLEEITSIQRLKTFYDDCLIIEYNKNYYVLNKYWWG